jgi:DNA mismatch repair protein MLH1
VTITSKTIDSPCAYKAKYMDGKIIPLKVGDTVHEPKPCAGIMGTSIVVEDLFYNMSTRRQAFKNTSDEYQRILDVITKYSIQYSNHADAKDTSKTNDGINSSNSCSTSSSSKSSSSSSSGSSTGRGVSFICKKQGQSIPDLHTQSTGSLLDNISIAYGSSVARELIDFSYDNRDHCPQRDKHRSALHHDLKVDNVKHHDVHDDVGNNIHIAWTGKVSNANYSTRKAIYILFINNRLIECSSIRKTIESVYSDILPRHAYPFVYLSIM